MLRAGIVGLPNVGKSTLFNAITRTRKAEAANYPFCTIDPNVGIVTVPDARLAQLQRIAKSAQVIPAAIEFVDIAGLVKGASQGEGLGNKFLTHIREVDALVQVVRCFEDADVHHVSGTVDPVRDIEVINTELVLSDLETVQKRRDRLSKEIKRGDKAAAAEDAVLAKIETALNAGKPALTVSLTPEEKTLAAGAFLLTNKPTIFACNVKESDLATADANPYVMNVREYVKTHLACEAVVISAQIESDLVDLAPDEADAFLKELGVEESGIGALIRATYHLLGLRTYFTAGEKEVRAWTIHAGDTAPKAAGVIHSDFERGFIKAETVAYDDLVRCGSVAAAREKGLYRMEGKEYVVKDGDVLLFKFNVGHPPPKPPPPTPRGGPRADGPPPGRPPPERGGGEGVAEVGRHLITGLKKVYFEFPRQFWIVVLVSFIDKVGGTLVFPFFSLYVTQKFHVGMTQAGIVLGIISFSSFIGGIIGGAVTDRLGRRKPILFGLVFSALSSLTLGFANNFQILYPLAVLIGLLSDVGGPAHGAMIADILPRGSGRTASAF